MPSILDDNAAEIKALRTGSAHRWFAVSIEVFDHEVVGTHTKAPPSADPDKQSWQPTVVWLWMLAQAAFQDRRVNVKGRVLQLRRGQFVCSERYLARQANWSRKAARGFLARLAKFDMVHLSTATREGQQYLLDFAGQKKGPAKGPDLTIVTIRNYDRYQFGSHIQGTSKGTSKGPARDQVNTKDIETVVTGLHRSKEDLSKSADAVTDDRLPFTKEVIHELSCLDGVDLEALLRKFKHTAKGRAIRDPCAYLRRMGHEAHAKHLGLSREQVTAILDRKGAEQVTAMANVVGVFSRPSDACLSRAMRRHGARVEQALACMAGTTFTNQAQADRVFEGHLANLRFRQEARS